MRLSLSLGAWWPEGRSSSSVSQFLPSCSWSAVVVLFCHHPPKYSSIFPRNTSSIQYYLIVSNYQDPTDSLMLFSYSLGSRRKQWGNFFYILSLSEPGFWKPGLWYTFRVKTEVPEACIRAVRLIEIEIKSRFEIARFLNRFIARFFFLRPCPNLPQYTIRTNQNAAEQNRPGIQTDSMLKKQGRWVQNRIRTWWPKKMRVACRAHSGE